MPPQPLTTGSDWRRRIAEKIAPAYARNPNIACILLGGSTARGQADRYSDIEIGVFWHTPPTDDDRRQAAALIPQAEARHYPYEAAEDAWADDLILRLPVPGHKANGVLVEVVHYTIAGMQRALNAVLDDFDTDLGKQNLVSALVDGMHLTGSATAGAWRQRASAYPDGLAQAMIERYGIIDHFWRWQMLLERGDNHMLLYQMFSQVEQQVLLVLLALNRQYYSGFKWIDTVIDRCPLQPPDLRKRLRAPFQAAPDTGARMLAGLVEDTFDLIARELPAVDVARLRGFFRHQRPFLDEAPGPEWD